MRGKRKGRQINGILVIDKLYGMSSNAVVQQVKKLFGARKVGHTGSLDPLATGILPLCFGEATKFSQFLLTSDKKYWTRLKLGVRTASGDTDSEVIEERPITGLSLGAIEESLEQFRGSLQQIPSMYSAIKRDGQPLYKLARQGIEVEREARPINIYSNEIVGYSNDSLELEIYCSKGTYIRTVADDLGQALGCGAHVVELRRTMAGPYTEKDLVSFDELEAARKNDVLTDLLCPIASAVRQWPAVRLNELSAYYLRQGQAVIVPHAPSEGWVCLLDDENIEGDEFIGVGEVLSDGRVAPRRLVSAGA